jgi:hypothetical protein
LVEREGDGGRQTLVGKVQLLQIPAATVGKPLEPGDAVAAEKELLQLLQAGEPAHLAHAVVLQVQVRELRHVLLERLDGLNLIVVQVEHLQVRAVVQVLEAADHFAAVVALATRGRVALELQMRHALEEVAQLLVLAHGQCGRMHKRLKRDFSPTVGHRDLVWAALAGLMRLHRLSKCWRRFQCVPKALSLMQTPGIDDITTRSI